MAVILFPISTVTKLPGNGASWGVERLRSEWAYAVIGWTKLTERAGLLSLVYVSLWASWTSELDTRKEKPPPMHRRLRCCRNPSLHLSLPLLQRANGRLQRCTGLGGVAGARGC